MPLLRQNYLPFSSSNRYEGEWLQNNMEGHGVVEVDIPDMEPVPGSKYVIVPVSLWIYSAICNYNVSFSL